jgi:hypothetical protein
MDQFLLELFYELQGYFCGMRNVTIQAKVPKVDASSPTIALDPQLPAPSCSARCVENWKNTGVARIVT